MSYDGFIAGFCKVEFLCHAGEPNWLGWGLLGFSALIVLGILWSFFGD